MERDDDDDDAGCSGIQKRGDGWGGRRWEGCTRRDNRTS